MRARIADDGAAVDLLEACEMYLEHRQVSHVTPACMQVTMQASRDLMYLEHRQAIDAGGGGDDDRLQLRGAFGGAYHSFLLTTSGNVYSFGLNNMGQVGSRDDLHARMRMHACMQLT